MTSSKLTVAFGCLLALSVVGRASAQTKIVPGETKTVTATVEAIEQSRRVLTVKDAKGEIHDLIVPASIERFSAIKPGDTLTVTYYDTITIRKKAANEPEVDTLHSGVTPTPGARPAGTASMQRTITATIDQLDMKIPSISFKGPRGWAYSTKVKDKEALAQVKVGDRVDITWTEAALVSLTPPKK